jgi:PAS domain S-box-containing protein
MCTAIAIVLNRFRYIGASILLTLAAVGYAVMHESTRNDGIRNVSLASIPVLIVIASLLLSRLGLVFFTGTAVLATVAMLETRYRLLGLETYSQNDLGDFIVYAIICAAAAVVGRILSEGIHKSLEQQTNRLSAVIASINDEVWFADTKKKLQFVNPAAIREFHLDNISGLELETLIASLEAFHPDGSPRTVEEAPLLRALRGEVIRSEEEIVWTPGRRELRNRQVNAAPVKDASGTILGSVCIVQDITVRKQSEAALRRTEARWNAAIENLVSSVVIATDTDRVIYQNPAAQAMHGFTSDQGIGPLKEMARTFQLRTPDGRLLSLDEWPLSRIKRGETLNRLELRLSRLDQGWEKIISYSGALVETAIGERLMFVSAQDLTDQRKAEQALRESEERLRLLGDNLPESAVYQYVHEPDGGGHFTYFSAGIERLCGVTVADVLRDRGTLFGQVLPEYIDWLREAELQSKRELSDFDLELPLRRPDGEVRWMHLHSRPRRLPGGRTIWDGVQTDVTERKHADDAREKQAELLRLSNDAMIVWRLDGPIENWNLGAEHLYGYSEAEAVGRLTHILLTRQFPKPWDEIVAEMRIAGSWEGEVRQHIQNRGETVVSARIQLIHGSDGIDRVLEVNRDITEARRAQLEEFERQKLESVGTLASGIAHDFNNLLGAVVAQAEVAMAELAAGSPPDQELKAIRDVAIRGSEIVRQLMIYAGKESDILELVDVSHVVEGILSLLKVGVSRHAVVVPKLSEGLPPVRARAAQVSQIVMNLVVNASDALGDRDGVIRVTTQHITFGAALANANGLPVGDYVRLEVSDTGSGMSAETLAKVFDPFFTTKFAGRGLGLAVVHGIVRNLGGAIQAASEPGKGTTFQILLPCVSGRAS